MYTNSFHPHVHIILFFLLSLYSWGYEHYQIVSPQFFLYHNRLTQNTPSLHFFSHEQNPTWIPPLGETAPPQFGVNILPLIPFIRNTASDFVKILIPAILHWVSSRGQYFMTKGNIMCKKIWPWEVQLMGRLSSTQEWGIFSTWHSLPFFKQVKPLPQCAKPKVINQPCQSRWHSNIQSLEELRVKLIHPSSPQFPKYFFHIVTISPLCLAWPCFCQLPSKSS